MQRYFINFNENDKYVKITGDDFHHLKNVLRMKRGDKFFLSNGELVYQVIIETLTNEFVLCELLNKIEENHELGVNVTIAQGMPKVDKFEFIIQKATELGVRELIPVLCDRSLVKVDGDKSRKKLSRFFKIAKGAAEQSERLMIPNVTNFMTLNELIAYSKTFTYCCVAYERATAKNYQNLPQLLEKLNANDKILFFIGPEGGISDKELALLTANNFITISLGKRILRTETAPLFILSAISYELELKG